jgi:hypothetical protein
MDIPRPPSTYDEADQAQLRQIIEDADAENVKRDTDMEFSGDDAITDRPRLVLLSADGTRWRITVDNAGAVSAAAL